MWLISFHHGCTNCLTQTWNLAYFPLNADLPYDRYGQVYNVSLVLDSSNRFNLTAYNEYSPLYLSATYAMTYLLAFALSTCVLVHTILYHGRSLVNGMKRIRVEQDDIHAKLMRSYPEVPDWWYIVSFVGFYLLMVVVVEVGQAYDSTACAHSRIAGVAHFATRVGTPSVPLTPCVICTSVWVHLRHDGSRSMTAFFCCLATV